ncbi:MAG: FHA domain-containing protein [Halieaceae bacterium]|nr:FHA domain-containing protein [Halieaceae bacterium]
MIHSFLRELKRRKVIKTCLFYVLLCWGALQVGDILFPAMDLDAGKASRMFLYLATLGFPLTFAAAWFFQLTPEGIVMTTSFVERRVLSNISPMNERRRDNMTTYFRREEEHPDVQWIVSAETGPLVGLSYGVMGPTVVGRALDCDIAVVSPQVSREHARLDIEQGQLMVEDLGSANGTVVNGKQVQGRHALQHEDELRLHEVVFRVTQNYSRPRSESDAMNETTLSESALPAEE